MQDMCLKAITLKQIAPWLDKALCWLTIENRRKGESFRLLLLRQRLSHSSIMTALFVSSQPFVLTNNLNIFKQALQPNFWFPRQSTATNNWCLPAKSTALHLVPTAYLNQGKFISIVPYHIQFVNQLTDPQQQQQFLTMLKFFKKTTKNFPPIGQNGGKVDPQKRLS